MQNGYLVVMAGTEPNICNLIEAKYLRLKTFVVPLVSSNPPVLANVLMRRL